MTQDIKATARRFYDEVVNGGNFDLIDDIVAPDFVEHEQFPELASGREGVKQFFSMMRSAFPDLHFAVEDLIVEGDRAVVRATVTGTHKGEFMGIPATGKSFTITAIDIVRFSGDKAAEHWGVTDTAGMMEQLGVAPPAA